MQRHDVKLSSRLDGKVAIVTGSGSGIGQGCALMFARHGARVIGCDLSPQGAEETLAIARAEGLAVESLHPLDLTRPAEVQRLVTHTAQRCGGVDILVNAAAWCAFDFIEKLDYERDWRRTLTSELDTVFLACQAVWPHLKTRGGGVIINFASVNAYEAHPVAGALAHCAGKGGVLAMTRQLASEGGAHRIRANSISPGLIVTGATRPELAKPGYEEAILTRKMIKRLGTPEDVAWCATFLVSDEAAWITGADFHVDGGATAW
jgi:NAD(P)-dependent dehydrogenase (short-subunit alcohol dehydrogenase family)